MCYYCCYKPHQLAFLLIVTILLIILSSLHCMDMSPSSRNQSQQENEPKTTDLNTVSAGNEHENVQQSARPILSEQSRMPSSSGKEEKIEDKLLVSPARSFSISSSSMISKNSNKYLKHRHSLSGDTSLDDPKDEDEKNLGFYTPEGSDNDENLDFYSPESLSSSSTSSTNGYRSSGEEGDDERDEQQEGNNNEDDDDDDDDDSSWSNLRRILGRRVLGNAEADESEIVEIEQPVSSAAGRSSVRSCNNNNNEKVMEEQHSDWEHQHNTKRGPLTPATSSTLDHRHHGILQTKKNNKKKKKKSNGNSVSIQCCHPASIGDVVQKLWKSTKNLFISKGLPMATACLPCPAGHQNSNGKIQNINIKKGVQKQEQQPFFNKEPFKASKQHQHEQKKLTNQIVKSQKGRMARQHQSLQQLFQKQQKSPRTSD